MKSSRWPRHPRTNEVLTDHKRTPQRLTTAPDGGGTARTPDKPAQSGAHALTATPLEKIAGGTRAWAEEGGRGGLPGTRAQGPASCTAHIVRCTTTELGAGGGPQVHANPPPPGHAPQTCGRSASRWHRMGLQLHLRFATHVDSSCSVRKATNHMLYCIETAKRWMCMPQPLPTPIPPPARFQVRLAD